MIVIARTLLAGAVGAGWAVALASQVGASPCDPDTMRMSPQPVLSCPGVVPAPQMLPPAAPIAAEPIAPPPPGPAGIAAAPVPALPAPGQAPNVPPVYNADGSQNFGSSGFFGDIWNQFHNGVPTDLIGGPAPAPPNP